MQQQNPKTSLPVKKVQIRDVLSSRYGDGAERRPFRWEERIGGVDTVRTVDGEVIALCSEADQSPPQPGWVLMLTDRVSDGFTWTLYGWPRSN